jgi:hypothetical protein
MSEITSGGFCFKIIKGMFLHPFLIILNFNNKKGP